MSIRTRLMNALCGTLLFWQRLWRRLRVVRLVVVFAVLGVVSTVAATWAMAWWVQTRSVPGTGFVFHGSMMSDIEFVDAETAAPSDLPVHFGTRKVRFGWPWRTLAFKFYGQNYLDDFSTLTIGTHWRFESAFQPWGDTSVRLLAAGPGMKSRPDMLVLPTQVVWDGFALTAALYALVLFVAWRSVISCVRVASREMGVDLRAGWIGALITVVKFGVVGITISVVVSIFSWWRMTDAAVAVSLDRSIPQFEQLPSEVGEFMVPNRGMIDASSPVSFYRFSSFGYTFEHWSFAPPPPMNPVDPMRRGPLLPLERSDQTYSVCSYGWPMRLLYASSGYTDIASISPPKPFANEPHFPDEIIRSFAYGRSSGKFRVVTRSPVPDRVGLLPLIFNTIFWGGGLWLIVWGSRRLTDRYTVRTGMCGSCGYDARGLARCPECGKAVAVPLAASPAPTESGAAQRAGGQS